MEESLNQLKEVVQNPKKVHPVKYALKTFHKNPKFYITSFVWSIISTTVGIGLFLNQERILSERKAQNLALQEDNKKIEKSLTELKAKTENSNNSNLEYQMTQMHEAYLKLLKADEILDSMPKSAQASSLRIKLNTAAEMIREGEVSYALTELDKILTTAQEIK